MIAALVVVATMAVCGWLSTQEPVDPPASRRSAQHVEEESPRRERPALARKSAATTTASVAERALPAGWIRVRGLVLQEVDPANEAHVSVTDEEGVLLASATTGSDGRFDIDLETSEYLRIDAVKDGGWRGSAFWWPTGAADLRVELLQGGLVEITVTDRSGRPAPGARVDGWRTLREIYAKVSFGPVFTDANGKVTAWILSGGEYDVSATHDDLGAVLATHVLSMREKNEIALEIAGSSAIRGVVLREREPLPRATVSIRRANNAYVSRRAVTDELGRFRLPAVAPGLYFADVEGSCAGSRITVEKLDTDQDMEIEIDARAAATIEGRVLGRKERPLAGWSVEGWSAGSASPSSTTSGADGTFVITACAHESYSLHTSRPREPNGGPEPQESAVVTAKAGDRGVILRGSEGATLVGEVRADDGSLHGYRVIIDGDTYYRHDHSFVIEGLAPRRAEVLLASWQGDFVSPVQTLTFADGETTQASFTLARASSLSGHVIDAKTGAPIANAWVEGRLRTNAVRTDAEGAFTLRGAGPVEIKVWAEGYGWTSAGPFEIGASMPVVISLDSAGPGAVRVTGRARAGAEPLGGSSIALIPRDANLYPREALVQPDGAFGFEGVAPGRYFLSVGTGDAERGPAPRGKLVSVAVPPEGISNLDVDLAAAGARLIVSFQAPARTMVYVMARDSEGAGAFRVAFAGTREVALEGLAPGTYQIVVVDSAGASPTPRSATISSVNEVARMTLP